MSADVLWREVPADVATGNPGVGTGTGAEMGAGLPGANQSDFALARRPARGVFATFREAVGLRRDLATDWPPPAAGMPINLVEIDGRELGDLLAETGERDHARAALACRQRRKLARRRIGRCFVALASGARPCFVQWLLDHTHNQALRHAFGDRFPHLMRDEALLEGGFTPATFDAARVMPAAMARIAARAAAQDVRWLHLFVPIEDPLTLRAGLAAGFAIHQWRRQRWGLWGRRTSFGPLPAEFDRRLG